MCGISLLPYSNNFADPVPPSDIHIETNTSGIEIRWSMPLYPAIDEIDHFRIIKTSGGITELSDVEKHNTSYLVTKMLAYEYCFQMITCTTTQGESKSSDTVKFTVLGTYEFLFVMKLCYKHFDEYFKLRCIG